VIEDVEKAIEKIRDVVRARMARTMGGAR
jgi:hypothetical protein